MADSQKNPSRKIGGAVVGAYQAVEHAVVGTYQKVEDTVVGAYKKVETGAVNGYRRVERHFTDRHPEWKPEHDAQDAGR